MFVLCTKLIEGYNGGQLSYYMHRCMKGRLYKHLTGFSPSAARLNGTESNIVVDTSEEVILNCTSSCGSILWDINGNYTEMAKTHYMCNSNGCNMGDSNLLDCSQAQAGKFVGSTLTLRPHGIVQVQCKSRLTIDGCASLFMIHSKAALITPRPSEQ